MISSIYLYVDEGDKLNRFMKSYIENLEYEYDFIKADVLSDKEGNEFGVCYYDGNVSAYSLSQEGRIRKIGQVKSQINDNNVLYISDINVTVPNIGIGGAMMKFAEKTAKEQGFKHMLLKYSNPTNKRFYQSHGFVENNGRVIEKLSEREMIKPLESESESSC